ncbi:hypothetical protein MSG28_012712 [Choristoneura fumiferana]|uniref:Uncharacterized protein n=1 Tax=Choristoneura fumiferana TaxID=7141 RepID=A0ACC0JHT7_CHOFU|nr:hypothetical protein MSG28_012712 [Choristoneura fumiferana]
MLEQEKESGGIKSIEKQHLYYEIKYGSQDLLGRIYILNGNIFRYYVSSQDFLDFPTPKNKEDVAKIVIKRVEDYDTVPFEISVLEEKDDYYIIDAEHIQICFDKQRATMTVKDKRANRKVLQEATSIFLSDDNTSQVLLHNHKEHFYGGGMQNGRFAHKGESIEIVNTNCWTDGGVSSPNPFYWSTFGYGVLRNTWQKGHYDFGFKNPNNVKTTHEVGYFDAFYFISSHPKDILLDYFRLTGRPILLPAYAFYEAHLNTFNRDYWVEVSADTSGAILFEDGKYYKKYQPKKDGENKGILESLNGEHNNYQFSARAMIDRYKRHDMPLGWFIPNDGYGSGYGQTDSLEGDLENLKEFADYARVHGVEVALWTESNLSPKDPDHPKKGERDLSREVSKAGVVALKCDVAWIGSGYSYGLNAVETATNIFEDSTKTRARPFIIMVDGWAGTQRYAGIWSGDQSGGEWEYIRFHVPTYIGTGLSGQPIVGSDMDGIYSGGVKEINIRDYQWKTFTPLQLNMDGWGSVPKTPFTFDDEAKQINRAYLKLKSMLMPYNYSINHESIRGLPMIRAMFLEFEDEIPAYTNDSKYQYMWGPNILVAPVITSGPVRNEIYLPGKHQVWIDFFTGEMYKGGKIYNNFEVPLWKIPVFIKNGAIIPMTNPNNNPSEIQKDIRMFNLYPCGETHFDVYEDDGVSAEYAKGDFAIVKVKMAFSDWDKEEARDLYISIGRTVGKYQGMVKERTTLLRIMTSVTTVDVKVMVEGEYMSLTEATSDEEFDIEENVYFLKEDFIVNPFLQNISEEKLKQKFLMIKLRKVDVTKEKIQLKVVAFANKREILGSFSEISYSIATPNKFVALESEATPTSVTLSWDGANDSTQYEIEKDGVIFSNIIGNKVTFGGLKYSSTHSFRIRVAILKGVSEWSDAITASTKEDPFKYAIKGVKVSCNLPCQQGQEVCKVTDDDMNSLWHTNWGSPGKANPAKGHFLKLNFDLGQVYEINKMVYTPRSDAGNGTFLLIQYKHSSDGRNWTPLSEKIYWDHDNSIKTIELNGNKLRYVELQVLESVGNFGSGKRIHFYKEN